MVRLTLPERIETQRLVLQRLRHEDAEEIFYVYASKAEATKFVSFPTHQSIYDSRKFVGHSMVAWNQGIEFNYCIRLKTNGKLIGSFGVINDDGKVSFGYALSPTYWNQGYTTEACRKIMDLLLKIRTVYRVWTLVDCENEASIKVLKKSGLMEEAKLEKWLRFPNQNNQPKDCLMFMLPLNQELK
ncbi:MAG: GNAT family N-acetyltransferase [Flammeovirgaceae bacterium]|nr:GNAT family N-acetyltransferase [Flammeovirgaceae bacterium]